MAKNHVLTNQHCASAERVPELVSAKALSARFGLTKKGVASLPIPKIKIGRRAIRYRTSDVLEFLERRTALNGLARSKTMGGGV